MKYHGDKPRLFEYDETEGIVDVFVYRDYQCPYTYTITNTRDDRDIWNHQGFYIKEFIRMVEEILEKLPKFCYSCGCELPVDEPMRPDPYASELNYNYTEYYICDECYSQSADDI